MYSLTNFDSVGTPTIIERNGRLAAGIVLLGTYANRKQSRQRSFDIVRETQAENGEAGSRFIQCAWAGDAEIIASGDSFLPDVREFRGVRILPSALFPALTAPEFGESQ